MAESIVLLPSLALDAPGARSGLPYDLQIGSVRLSTLDARSIRTAAVHPDDTGALSHALGGDVPAVGSSWLSPDGPRLLGVQRDQFWLLDGDAAAPADGLWWIDQSDGWATLVIEGDAVIAVLERVCPIDVHADVFPAGAVARTVFEHLAVVVLRTDKRRFELLTPRSSVVSFAHALEGAAAHVAAERSLRTSPDVPA